MTWFVKLVIGLFEHMLFDRKEVVVTAAPDPLVEMEPDVVWEAEYDDDTRPVSTSPCTVICTTDFPPPALQTKHVPYFCHHSEICTHLLTKFELFQGLVNHDLLASGWKGDIGCVFDPVGVLATTFQVLFILFQHIIVDATLDAIQERVCICACLTTSMKFLRRSAMYSVPKWGHVYLGLFPRGALSDETMHTLVERWEVEILKSQINLLSCAMANAASIAEFELERWLSSETGNSDVATDERIYLLRNISTFLFLSLHVSGSDLLDMAKSETSNALLGRSLALAARAIGEPTSIAFDEGDAEETTTAAAVVSGLIDSPQCKSMLAQGRSAQFSGQFLSHKNLRRSIKKLDKLHN